MIVDDMSDRLPKGMAKRYEDELYRLRKLFNQWHNSDRSDRDCNLLLYLMRRAWRPIYAYLKARYIKLWGPKATFSYFFPEHTHNAIWHRVTDRLKGKPKRTSPCKPSPDANI
jgi:hypothetical protein